MGLEVARQLAQKGASIIIVARDPIKLREGVKYISVRPQSNLISRDQTRAEFPRRRLHWTRISSRSTASTPILHLHSNASESYLWPHLATMAPLLMWSGAAPVARIQLSSSTHPSPSSATKWTLTTSPRPTWLTQPSTHG